MENWYELKVRRILGGESGDTEEISILNRTLGWVSDVMSYEADHEHVDLICEEICLERTSNGLSKGIPRETFEDFGCVIDEMTER